MSPALSSTRLEDGQAEVIAFLSRPGSFAPGTETVERFETHGALVFLAGDQAVKIKRAIRYPYLDFSTLPKRRAALERELALNQPRAPGLYLDVFAITRGADGRIALDGRGETIEWCLRMRRFDQAGLFSNIAASGFGEDILKALADEVERSHAAAPAAAHPDPVTGPEKIVAEVAKALEQASATADAAGQFQVRASGHLRKHAGLLGRRAAAGKIRRCHGDLHLANIVLWEGRPTLFDALEFDEELATIDTLYDLAFLLMDLDIRAGRASANRVLNRYLWRTQDDLDLDGLALLPLFLALRAGVRAMVSTQRAHIGSGGEAEACARDAQSYLGAALEYLRPPGARLIAVGGFSGTGKSTLAAALAPEIGAAPGALHLRSDLERKALHHAEECDRLDDAAYTQEESVRVYERIDAKAARALAANHGVIIDAVFAKPEERAAVERSAKALGIPFRGIWLEAPAEILRRRVASRTGDASDATPDVVDRQLQGGAGAIGWQVVDASGPAGETVERARRTLGLD